MPRLESLQQLCIRGIAAAAVRDKTCWEEYQVLCEDALPGLWARVWRHVPLSVRIHRLQRPNTVTLYETMLQHARENVADSERVNWADILWSAERAGFPNASEVEVQLTTFLRRHIITEQWTTFFRNCVLMGGSVVRFLLQNSPRAPVTRNIVTEQAFDLDCFLYNTPNDQLQMTLLEKMSCVRKHRGRPLRLCENGTIHIPLEDRPLSLVPSTGALTNPVQLLYNVDLACTQVFFDGCHIYGTESFWCILRNNVPVCFEARLHELDAIYKRRLQKYQEYGFVLRPLLPRGSQIGPWHWTTLWCSFVEVRAAYRFRYPTFTSRYVLHVPISVSNFYLEFILRTTVDFARSDAECLRSFVLEDSFARSTIPCFSALTMLTVGGSTRPYLGLTPLVFGPGWETPFCFLMSTNASAEMHYDEGTALEEEAVLSLAVAKCKSQAQTWKQGHCYLHTSSPGVPPARERLAAFWDAADMFTAQGTGRVYGYEQAVRTQIRFPRETPFVIHCDFLPCGLRVQWQLTAPVGPSGLGWLAVEVRLRDAGGVQVRNYVLLTNRVKPWWAAWHVGVPMRAMPLQAPLTVRVRVKPLLL